MKIIKVSEAEGVVLDWLVATCEYDELAAKNIQYPEYAKHYPKVSPSTNWALGGPILERERIAIRESKSKWYAMTSADLGDGERAQWVQFTFRNVPKTASTSRRCRFTGPTPLIAAMRCYVASKLGDEVEVPEELL